MDWKVRLKTYDDEKLVQLLANAEKTKFEAELRIRAVRDEMKRRTQEPEEQPAPLSTEESTIY